MAPKNSTSKIGDGDGHLLLFGGQALRFDADAFVQLRSTVWNTPEQAWITEAITSLPGCWNDFIKAFPRYGVIDNAPRLLVDMDEWFKNGSMQLEQHGVGPIPNMILSPLVVITHLVDYMSYLDMAGFSKEAPGVPWTGALGFCTGILSAFAVALSKNRSEVRTYGAKVVRLAMLIGGVVDAQGRADAAGPAKALATVWNSTEGGEELRRILKRYPEVRIPLSLVSSFFCFEICFEWS